ncbi:MAG: type II toxin-antitoxin system VapC family toxin [Gemmatimonadales bacterium]
MNLLDTDVCVDVLRGTYPTLARRIAGVGADQIAVSAITAGELFTGALKSSRVAESILLTELLLSGMTILAFDAEASRTYGLIRTRLERKGQKIGDMDTLIAAHAVTLDAVLVTRNTREFSHVDELRIEDWTR